MNTEANPDPRATSSSWRPCHPGWPNAAPAASSTWEHGGQVGLAGGAAYGATKAAQGAMARAWAAEFSPGGVRVNAVAPGPVFTGGAAPDRTERLGSTALLNRAAQPQEIAEVVAFLASPKASFLTGATIAVNGGRTAGVTERWL